MTTKKLLALFKNKLKDYANFVIIVFLCLLALSLYRNISRIKKAQERVKEVEERVEELKEENIELKIQAENAKSELFMEKQLRDKLGLAKEGEIVVVLPEDRVLRKLAPKRPKEENVLPNPNWKKWWNLFN